MEINKEKLEEIAKELYDETHGISISTSVCIYKGKDLNGEPLQIILTATVDEDELISKPSNKFICIS